MKRALWLILLAACSSSSALEVAGGQAVVGAEPDATAPDAGTLDASSDAPTSLEAQALVEGLGDSVWNGTATRNGKTRSIELRFRSSSLQWAEIQNPFGPSRKRELRAFTVDPKDAAVRTVVNTPLFWPDRTDTTGPSQFKLKIIEGTPRKLEVTREGGTVETYTEGAVPKPTSGLTAHARVFPTGPVNDAFCASGAGGFDYPTLFDFARDKSGTELGHDVVAGAKLRGWVDDTAQNKFSITDVDGFDKSGFTELSDTFNFVVRYTGTITHPGGSFSMRERDDAVEDGVWAFFDTKVGSQSISDLFLEVHGFVWPETTANAPSVTRAAGKVPIEIIVVRCAKQITPVHVEISSKGAPFSLVGDAATEPEIDDTLFPSAL